MNSKNSMWNVVKLLSGPLFFLLIWLLGPFDHFQNATLGVAIWMIFWWTTQIIPIGVTALLPMILFPAMGIDSIKNVTVNYANPIIYLFFGGFVLGLALEKWNLHQRLALNILRISGTRPRNIIAGSMLATAIMSMWISNTAATMMMLPIGLSIVSLIENQLEANREKRNFALCLLLGLAFSANVGGMATLIGTPTNLVLAALVSESLGVQIGFSEWFMFALPISAILFFAILQINVRFVFPVKNDSLKDLSQMISQKIQLLGKPGAGEIKVFLVFLSTALLWIFRAPLSTIESLSFLSDPLIAVLAAVSLFAIPSGEGRQLLKWEDTCNLPWDILLLFGGGLSLAAGLESSGVVQLLGNAIIEFQGIDWLLVVLLITFISVFLTECMSNVALVSVFIPIAIIIAPSLGGSGLELAIPLTLGASCAFMLPIATPPNAIVFASNKITMAEMVRTGFIINVFATIFIALYCYYLVPRFFG